MTEFDQARELLMKRLSVLDSLDAKEKYLRRVLIASVFDRDQLLQVKAQPEITRHLSLIHLIEKHLENQEFKKRNEEAKNESLLVILAGIPFLTPF